MGSPRPPVPSIHQPLEEIAIPRLIAPRIQSSIVPSLAILLVLLATLPAPAHGTEPTAGTLSLQSPDLAAVARSLAPGGTLRVEGVELTGAGASATTREGSRTMALDLRRVEVFTRDARVVVHDSPDAPGLAQAPPAVVHLRGRLVEASAGPASPAPDTATTAAGRAVLSVLPDGRVRGLVLDRGRFWILDTAADGSGHRALRAVSPERETGVPTTPFRCGNDALGTPDARTPRAATLDALDQLAGSFEARLGGGDGPRSSTLAGEATRTARVAVDTDFEFYSLFGDVTAAATYVADLFAYTSLVYEAETATALTVSRLDLWTGAGDPWDEFNPTCGMFELGAYWNQNRTGVERTVVHFLSGKQVGGGVAWIGSLCSGPFNYPTSAAGCPDIGTDTVGGDYGWSGGLSGLFSLANPAILWDLMVVSHELGHSFNSPHTHCYEGLGGNAAPVDECWSGQCGQSGCYCGSQGLPCPGGQRACGTIMSYCHLLGGGLSNIAFTFGDGHPWGTDPERVPARMTSFVDGVSSSNPGCFGPPPTATDTDIFSDGFEAGNLSSWSSSLGS